jgi:hypothetical protein
VTESELAAVLEDACRRLYPTAPQMEWRMAAIAADVYAATNALSAAGVALPVQGTLL